MPLDVIFSPEAEDWLTEHLAGIKVDNPAMAARILEKIRAKLSLVADFPKMTEEGLIPGTRKVLVKDETVKGDLNLIVRVTDTAVEVAAMRAQTQGDALAPSEISDDLEEEDRPSEGSPFSQP